MVITVDISYRTLIVLNISNSSLSRVSLPLLSVTALSECWHLDERSVMEGPSNEAKEGDCSAGVGLAVDL